MIRPTLAQTLTALAEGATPTHPGLSVAEAEIDLPLIVTLEHGTSGPVLVAHPPFSVFRSGFDPVAHRARLLLGEVPHGADPDSTAASVRPRQTAIKATGSDGAA